MQGLLEIIGVAEEIVELSKENKPKIQGLVKELMSYGPELYEVFLTFSLATVDAKIAMIKKYEEAGFDRKDAIQLTTDSLKALSSVSKNQSSPIA